jgi:precorrin-8X/cobalt-precorrin-8 methylmutase
MSAWPVPGGFLRRLGRGPEDIEGRSRAAARALVGERWAGDDAELAASVVYAGGDPALAERVRLSGDVVARARRALDGGAPILVDVAMVAAGIRLPIGRRLAVAIRAPRAASLAAPAGTTRSAAGIELCWEEFGAGGVVAIGNAPTALLAALDAAAAGRAPACVIATCPGFHVAAEAKAVLAASTLPHLVVEGSGGGSGLAAAAVNFLLEGARRGR